MTDHSIRSRPFYRFWKDGNGVNRGAHFLIRSGRTQRHTPKPGSIPFNPCEIGKGR